MRDTAPVPEWTQGRPRLDELGWGLGRNRDRGAVAPGARFHPRTNQISTRPSTAETMPAIRSDVSGLSSALAANRLATRGKAANSSPSITSTRPIATMNWAILPDRSRDGDVPPAAYFAGAPADGMAAGGAVS